MDNVLRFALLAGQASIRADRLVPTMNHCPQSQPLACLGGLTATRSIGQFSTYYGGIEDLVCGLEAVLPNGEVVRIRNVPRRSAGPPRGERGGGPPAPPPPGAARGGPPPPKGAGGG